MFRHSRSHKSGFTLIELLVVIVILAVLIGLLLSAVQKVREAAARAQSSNNLRQIILATHSYHDANNTIPLLQNESYVTAGGVSGCFLFFILPYMEESNVFQSAFGPVTLNWDYPPYSTPPSPLDPPVAAGYQASRAVGSVKSYLSPLDYSYPASYVFSPTSYLANADVFTMTKPFNFNQIADGLSNTMFYAEGLSNCPMGSSSWTTIKMRAWNFDPNLIFNRSDSHSERDYSIPSYSTPALTNNWITAAAAFSPFQNRPPLTACNDAAAQGLSSGGLLIALGDGSARIVNPSIAQETFTAAATPNSGDLLLSDW